MPKYIDGIEISEDELEMARDMGIEDIEDYIEDGPNQIKHDNRKSERIARR